MKIGFMSSIVKDNKIFEEFFHAGEFHGHVSNCLFL
jgi:hypothetical protein